MRSLLILTGIILLSFQINRIIVNNTDKAVAVSDVKLLDDAFISNTELPKIDSVYRSAKSIKTETGIAENAAIKTPDTGRSQNSEKNTVKVTSLFSKEHNKNLVMLHKLIKETGNYAAFSTVQFSNNAYNALDSESFQAVMKFADQLVFDESLKLSIAGFTDNRGSAAYNEQLSWLRANDVRKYFIELGVKENQIMISANGTLDPVASNNTAEGRAQNRRVEMVLLK